MRTCHALCSAVVAAGLLATLPAVSFGARGSSVATPPRDTTNQNSQTTQAGKQVADAQKARNLVVQQMNKLKNKVRVSLEAKPEWAKAKNDRKVAQAKFEAARTAELLHVHG